MQHGHAFQRGDFLAVHPEPCRDGADKIGGQPVFSRALGAAFLADHAHHRPEPVFAALLKLMLQLIHALAHLQLSLAILAQEGVAKGQAEYQGHQQRDQEVPTLQRVLLLHQVCVRLEGGFTDVIEIDAAGDDPLEGGIQGGVGGLVDLLGARALGEAVIEVDTTAVQDTLELGAIREAATAVLVLGRQQLAFGVGQQRMDQAACIALTAGRVQDIVDPDIAAFLALDTRVQRLSQLIGDQKGHHLRVDMHQRPGGRLLSTIKAHGAGALFLLPQRHGKHQPGIRAAQELCLAHARVEALIQLLIPPVRVERGGELHDVDPVRVDAQVRELAQQFGADEGAITTTQMADAQ